jgi:hypothetical protein
MAGAFVESARAVGHPFDASLASGLSREEMKRLRFPREAIHP